MNWVLCRADSYEGITIETKRLPPAIEKSLREAIAINPANRYAEEYGLLDNDKLFCKLIARQNGMMQTRLFGSASVMA